MVIDICRRDVDIILDLSSILVLTTQVMNLTKSNWTPERLTARVRYVSSRSYSTVHNIPACPLGLPVSEN
jgi:hypothetical protein